MEARGIPRPKARYTPGHETHARRVWAPISRRFKTPILTSDHSLSTLAVSGQPIPRPSSNDPRRGLNSAPHGTCFSKVMCRRIGGSRVDKLQGRSPPRMTRARHRRGLRRDTDAGWGRGIDFHPNFGDRVVIWPCKFAIGDLRLGRPVDHDWGTRSPRALRASDLVSSLRGDELGISVLRTAAAYSPSDRACRPAVEDGMDGLGTRMISLGRSSSASRSVYYQRRLVRMRLCAKMR